MKKTLFTIALLCVWAMASGQSISGTWNGNLTILSQQFKIVFNIAKVGKTYHSTMDCPNQKAFEASTKSTVLKDSVLTIKMAREEVEYEGRLTPDGKFVGVLNQGGQLFPLDLVMQKKTASDTETRERNPVNYNKCYSYYSDSITFTNPKDNIKLAGTISIPIGKKKFPAVVLISAGGPHNRDAEQFGHKPFEKLADYLTSNGVAVLRFDDRGTALSGGNYNEATTYDLATDVEAAIDYIKSRNDLQITKIGLIGHSEGGIIAPLVATKSSNVDFMVLMAAPGVSGHELLLAQIQNTGEIVGAGAVNLSDKLLIDKGMLDIVRSSDNNDKLKRNLTEYIRKNIDKKPFSSTTTTLDSLVAKLTSPWLVNFVKLNPAEVMEKVTCPVLAMYGSKDVYVSPETNSLALKLAFEKSGNKKTKTKVLKGLNHNFQECKTGQLSEYSTIKQTISADALEHIGFWVLRNSK